MGQHVVKSQKDKGQGGARKETKASRVMLAVLMALMAGAVLWGLSRQQEADFVWALAVMVTLVPLGVSVAQDLRRGETGVDLIALLAMAGSLILGQYLAGAVVGLMLSGGQTLENYAQGRSRKELKALLERAPRIVHRYQGGKLTEPKIEEVKRDDLLLVKGGEMVPVDGVVATEVATLDESALTGESQLAERLRGDVVHSGAVNAGAPFDMRALREAEESTYAGIIRLVRKAETEKAPFVRLADRYALWFLPLTLGVAGGAWVLSGDPVRALAVLVVATPCPLILAAPVAIVTGISRAASRGIIVKGGGALEALGRAQTLVFDKTGTLTTGIPRVVAMETFGTVKAEDMLRMAAGLEQVSTHVFADAVVGAARERDLELAFPSEVKESAGTGIEGKVEGRRLALGQARWLAGKQGLTEVAARLHQKVEEAGLSSVFIALEGEVVGALVMEDSVRSESKEALRGLREAGVRRIVLLSGDRQQVTEEVGATLGVDEVMGEKTPSEKAEAVRIEKQGGVTVMVGDGINDAPALAAADVGVAMGARGATASSEAADVVIMVDSLSRVTEAVLLARRAREIALQSVLVGMGLSGAGMILASVGVLSPVAGAVFQEVIDVAVVLNALRVLGGGRAEKRFKSEQQAQRMSGGSPLRIASR